MEELEKLAGLLIIPVLLLWIYSEYRYRKNRDITGEKKYREQLAKDLQTGQDEKAERLENKTDISTRQNKQDLMEILIKSVNDMTTTVNHKFELVYKTFENQNTVIEHVIKDAVKDNTTRDEAMGQLRKGQDILSQWYYGVKVKSDWPLLSDKTEPAEHRETQHSLDPQESIFSPTQEERENGIAIPDSNEYFETNKDGTKGKKVEERRNGD